jgi:hypothetical protein
VDVLAWFLGLHNVFLKVTEQVLNLVLNLVLSLVLKIWKSEIGCICLGSLVCITKLSILFVVAFLKETEQVLGQQFLDESLLVSSEL